MRESYVSSMRTILRGILVTVLAIGLLSNIAAASQSATAADAGFSGPWLGAGVEAESSEAEFTEGEITTGTLVAENGTLTDNSVQFRFSWSGFESTGSPIEFYELWLGVPGDSDRYGTFLLDVSTTAVILTPADFDEFDVRFTDGDYRCSVRLVTETGGLSDFASVDFLLDSNAPELGFSSSVGTQFTQPFILTLSASEFVTDVELDDLILSNATAQEFQGKRAGTAFLFAIDPINFGTVTVGFRVGGAFDQVGNSSGFVDAFVGTYLEEIDPPEGEAEEGEAELPPGEEICRYTLRGNKVVPPVQTPFTGVLSVYLDGDTVSLLLTHDAPDPQTLTFNLGPPGGTGPALISFPRAVSPVLSTVPRDTAETLTQNTYVELSFGGDSPSAIRANLSCSFPVEPDGEAGSEGEAEGDDEGEGTVEGGGEGGGEAAPEGEAAQEGEGIPEAEGEAGPEGEAAPDGEGDFPPHSADYLGGASDGRITLPEMLRLVQFYNAGAFSCAVLPTVTEDGYQIGEDGDQNCAPHSSDYADPGPNWRIELSELLRLVQIYTVGSFRGCGAPSSEDGFCLGAS